MESPNDQEVFHVDAGSWGLLVGFSDARGGPITGHSVVETLCLNFPHAHFVWQTVSPGYSPSKGECNAVDAQLQSECNAVDAQLQSLQDSHVGYKRMDISELKLSVIGARPFSSGGETFGPAYGIITQRFGIQGMNHSARKISSLALQSPTEHVLVFLGHNGPTGLGSSPMDICGKDWSAKSSGDHGDPDLEAALKTVKERGSHNVQLVIFGHMHKTLCLNRGNRTMLVRGQDNIMYVNAAVVPRVIDINASECSTQKVGLQTLRNFTVVDLVNGQVEKVAETWVRAGNNVAIESETILYHSVTPQQGV
ncbi:hypothetical protein L7F22_027083 [Adiantum nelumboides]|nr:hypothetical protein [Adiantum nelumboides]